MKKTILGGFIFVGGAIMLSVGMFGVAHVEVQAQPMQTLQYLGALLLIAGIALGVFGLKSDK